MRKGVYTTLIKLYRGKEVTANSNLECNTTRITNEISILRNELGIDIITDRIKTKYSWCGAYRLNRTPKNLKIVSEVLKTFTKQNEAKTGKN